MPLDPTVHLLVVGIRGRHKAGAAAAQGADGVVDVGRGECDMLDPLPLVLAQVLLNLRLVIRRLVDGDADLATGGSHGA